LISPAAFAQSESATDDSSESVKALEESLQREKEELERAVTERESLLSDQAKIRDELEAERKALEEKQQQLLELCEKHNDANPNSPRVKYVIISALCEFCQRIGRSWSPLVFRLIWLGFAG